MGTVERYWPIAGALVVAAGLMVLFRVRLKKSNVIKAERLAVFTRCCEQAAAGLPEAVRDLGLRRWSAYVDANEHLRALYALSLYQGRLKMEFDQATPRAMDLYFSLDATPEAKVHERHRHILELFQLLRSLDYNENRLRIIAIVLGTTADELRAELNHANRMLLGAYVAAAMDGSKEAYTSALGLLTSVNMPSPTYADLGANRLAEPPELAELATRYSQQ